MKIYNIFKPRGLTSAQVVNRLKRSLGKSIKKIGHFGTLDPFATGVLLVATDSATRLNELVHASFPKTYLAVGKLGIATDSGDYTGEEKSRDDSEFLKTVIAHFDRKFIQESIQDKFLGTYWQAPPAFSATKFQGKKLCDWKRQGVEIKKQPVERFIHEIEVVHFRFPYLSLRVQASSGTYIRTLFEDIAVHLGTVGTLVGLMREQVGDACSRAGIPLALFEDQRDAKSILMTDFFKFKKVILSLEDSIAYGHGNPVTLSEESKSIEEERVWVYSNQQELLGLGLLQQGGLIKVIFNLPVPQKG